MNITMFIIGSIIFVAYMFGLLYAVNWGHTTQRDEMERDRELQQFEAMQIEFAKLQDWKAGAQKVIWLIATAAGGMWVKHFMDLMMK